MWHPLAYLMIGLMVTVLLVTVWNLCRTQHVIENYSDDEYLEKIRRQLITIYPPVEPILVLKSGYSSFTRDKQVITLCLRDPTTGRFYSEKTILYVALHEVAHLISESYSVDTHNEEFHEKFDMLRDRAYRLGYLPSDFRVDSTWYCKVSL